MENNRPSVQKSKTLTSHSTPRKPFKKKKALNLLPTKQISKNTYRNEEDEEPMKTHLGFHSVPQSWPHLVILQDGGLTDS